MICRFCHRLPRPRWPVASTTQHKSSQVCAHPVQDLLIIWLSFQRSPSSGLFLFLPFPILYLVSCVVDCQTCFVIASLVLYEAGLGFASCLTASNLEKSGQIWGNLGKCDLCILVCRDLLKYYITFCRTKPSHICHICQDWD